ncbi:MAG TPA: glycine zipper domain-containing protein [Opitutaceae bacterium]|nr:glycine zipper domain-containing protein [Opitutaceae bacterium]
MKTSHALPLAAAVVLALSACATAERTIEDNPNAARKAGIGAAAGAVIGGIIGHQSGNTTEGAAVGAAVGGIAGGAVGAREDRQYRTGDTPRDRYGFTSGDYLTLMTDQEMRILQSRAPNTSGVDLANYLTDEERANLRRRAGNRAPIG